jgi:hypothetical protein
MAQRIAMDGTFSWLSANGSEEYLYEEWSDRERDETMKYTSEVISNGSRLWVSADALGQYLLKTGFDLLVEVAVRRGRGHREYQRENSEETTEARYDRVFVLRRDGTIEAAEGPIGTWRTPRA